MDELIAAGYFPKRTAAPDSWRKPGLEHIAEICSVSNCIASGPEGWIERGIHNEFGFFNTRSDAEIVLPEVRGDFRLFAYRLLPRRFKKHRISQLKISGFEVEPLSSDWAGLGFDIVNRTVFGCSPLSCNAMAAELPGVNRYCLVDTLGEAVLLAERFSREEPEPGPYFVIEVLRTL